MSPSESTQLRFSVIVPVFNHWRLVPSLLEGLTSQRLDPSSFELILVDNGSDEVPRSADLPEFARLVHCDQPGSYAARNTGAAVSQGEVLAFTDADCLPEPQWLAELDNCFRSVDRVDVLVAGSIRVVAGEPKTPAARYDEVMGLPQARYVGRGYGVTANLAVPRELFERVGGFDERRLSGGDAAFCRTATEQGADLVYCAPARVVHPARTDMRELTRKVRRVKGGQLRNGPWHRRILYGVRGFLPPLRAWQRILAMPGLGNAERFLLVRVQARLWLVEMMETARLLSGGKPERR